MSGGTALSLVRDDRGQTVQDYAIGISVFLLTVAIVLSTGLPTVLAIFEDDTRGNIDAQAD